jgi:hypothetical protein
MSAVGEVLDRQDRPSFVRFERVPYEDKAASIEAGHYVARDVDLALVTAPYGKDTWKVKVSSWWTILEQDVHNGRISSEWVAQYKKMYEAWKNGQELPLNGTAIKGWGVISPAQQETLIRMNMLTVEDLAQVNDEGLKRIGMGSLELKNKAKAWLSQLQDKGPLTQEIAFVKADNEVKAGQIETLNRQIQELTVMVRSLQNNPKEATLYSPAYEATEVQGIVLSDILEPTKEDLAIQYEAKFGKPPHHMMKVETIQKALE